MLQVFRKKSVISLLLVMALLMAGAIYLIWAETSSSSVKQAAIPAGTLTSPSNLAVNPVETSTSPSNLAVNPAETSTSPSNLAVNPAGTFTGTSKPLELADNFTARKPDNPSAQLEEILPVQEAFNFGYVQGANDWTVFWQVLPGYYLYRDKVRVMAAGQAMDVTLPTGKLIDDPTFGKVEVLQGYVELQLPTKTNDDQGGRLAQAGDSSLSSLEIFWQGCAAQGYCYPPQKMTLASE